MSPKFVQNIWNYGKYNIWVGEPSNESPSDEFGTPFLIAQVEKHNKEEWDNNLIVDVHYRSQSDILHNMHVSFKRKTWMEHIHLHVFIARYTAVLCSLYIPSIIFIAVLM